jgi:hypothetical protein
LRMAALLSLAATALAITSYSMLRAQAAPAAAPSAAGASGPKPDGSYPPAAEAIAVPAETQWSAPQRHGQWQEPLPEVPRHPVGGYNYNRTPYQEMASHPRRQAQPAVEVMMA